MNPGIRHARPTDTDAAAFAYLANMASHDILGDLVGNDVEQVLAAMFLREDNLYSHRQVWFIEAEQGIAGMLCAFTGRQKAALNAETDSQLIEGSGPEPDTTGVDSDQLQPISEFIDTVPVDAFYIQFLAVYPHVRGKGYARQLLVHAGKLARKHGARSLELDVETGNEPALTAYRKSGLEITDTSKTVTYDRQQRTLALHRMVKAIS